MSRLRITLEQDGVKGELLDGAGIVHAESVPFTEEDLSEKQTSGLTLHTLFTSLQRLLDTVQSDLPSVEEVIPVVWSYTARLSFNADQPAHPSSASTLICPSPSAARTPPFLRTIPLSSALSRLLALSTAHFEARDGDPASGFDTADVDSSCQIGSYWSARYDHFRPRLLPPIPSSLCFSTESTRPPSQTASPTYISTSSIDTLLVPIPQGSLDTTSLYPGGTVVWSENLAWWVWEDTHHAGVRVALRDKLANGKWSQFDQTIGILPPGGTLGLDDKAFLVSLGRHLPQEDSSERSIRFEGGQPVGSFRDPRADIRCVVESQAFALADMLDMLHHGGITMDTLIVRADWMGPSTHLLLAQVTGMSIVSYPLTEARANSLSVSVLSAPASTPTPPTPPSQPLDLSRPPTPPPSSPPSSRVRFAITPSPDLAHAGIPTHDLPTPCSSPTTRPPCPDTLETAREGVVHDVGATPCHIAPSMLHLGSWESTLYPALREEYRRLRDIADKGLVRRPLPSPPFTLPPSPLSKTTGPLRRTSTTAERSTYS